MNSETKNTIILFTTVILAFFYGMILCSIMYSITHKMDIKERFSIGICLSLIVLFLTAFLAGLTYHLLWKKYNRENYNEYHPDE